MMLFLQTGIITKDLNVTPSQHVHRNSVTSQTGLGVDAGRVVSIGDGESLKDRCSFLSAVMLQFPGPVGTCVITL